MAGGDWEEDVGLRLVASFPPSAHYLTPLLVPQAVSLDPANEKFTAGLRKAQTKMPDKGKAKGRGKGSPRAAGQGTAAQTDKGKGEGGGLLKGDLRL